MTTTTMKKPMNRLFTLPLRALGAWEGAPQWMQVALVSGDMFPQ
jgi:hypothetical protein